MLKCDFNSNFIEIAFRYGCSPVNLLHIFRTTFPRNTSGWLLLGLFSGAYFQHIFRIKLTKFHYQTFFTSQGIKQLMF